MKTIRQMRDEHGWTQLQLAVKLGVTPVTVYNWERGKTEPRLSQFRELARLFAVGMDEIALEAGAGGAQSTMDGSNGPATADSEGGEDAA